MMWLSLLVLAVSIVKGKNCVYKDSSTGQILYLDALEHATLALTSSDPRDDHTYTYTPCRNAAGNCSSQSSGSGGKQTSMVRQSKEDDPNFCSVVANVDFTVTPTFIPNANNGTWTFEFENGDDTGCATARKFRVDFVCDHSAGDYQIQNGGIKDVH